ncbi:putative transposase [Bradyrhizobium sp. USDA 10063]
MSNDNIIKLIQPGNVDDQLTEILRNGARALLAQAVEAEVADFLGEHADLKTVDGHQRVVRHGHLPEREVMTGIGPVAVRQPRVRDREANAADPGRIRFSPSILPPYMRRSKSIETLLPILYLKGISTGDFSEALAALLGKDAAGLSASAIGRLKDGWLAEHTAWQRRDLSAKRYVYIWADGIHLQARLEDEKQCILVLIGATPEGRKELVGFTDGARESAHDWRDLLLELKRRGLDVPPRLAIADGALGFWKAAGEVWPKTREQCCWVHKTANVLAKLPKSQQPKAKRALQEIWMAETKAGAELAFDAFIESYTPKYEKAADCLSKDRDTLLAFYDFPAEHWVHLRTTDEMDKRFFMTEMAIAEIAYVHSFVRPRCGPFFRPGHRSRSRRAQGRSRLAAFAATARLGLDRPEHGGMLAWNGTAFLAGTCRQRRLWLSGAGDLVAKRDASAASVTGLPILSCRAEAPARRVLAAAVSIAPPIVRSFAPPGRQSTSHGRAAP